MNEQILELAAQAGLFADLDGNPWPRALSAEESVAAYNKFAELIVGECIKQAHGVGDLRGANDDMIYGADTAALRISKHFGVE